ncbi:DUF4031 domain-containing protein [Acinetobacter sp. ANC 3832]|uniref:DUF4031 domain-containing protein n=1 Tax=Acinetobacter sp. ANC 3832 TaxID=1977874 RepID=UPI000A33D687|nr:DUF4031 domain-containing protein [Acinetobacter sp. ANC 3832]OTG95752.1 hypothetical protein B9T35_04225 [Acinetobacter sp. ANC 3832]
MAIYVDRAKVSFRGQEWCHLMADTLDELHYFVKMVGIDARLFHQSASYPHYDITLSMRMIVLAHGAIDADRKMIIRCGKKLKQELQLSQIYLGQ